MRGPEFHHQPLSNTQISPPLSEEGFDGRVREGDGFGGTPQQVGSEAIPVGNGFHEAALPPTGVIMEGALPKLADIGVPPQKKDAEPQEPSTLLGTIVRQYQEFHNFEPHPENRKAHNTHTDELYSASYLPALVAIYNRAWEQGDQEVIHQTYDALRSLEKGLNTIRKFADDRSITAYDAFLQMRREDAEGKSRSFFRFERRMRKARGAAYTVIKSMTEITDEQGTRYRDYLPFDQEVTIKNGSETIGKFGDIAKKAVLEYEEQESGIELGKEFAEKLHDPNTKAVVLSIDINSTLNVGESYASSRLLDQTTIALQVLANRMNGKYPDKKVYFVLNTGRPSMYAWGISEALPPIPEMRVFGIGEAGGVVYRIRDARLKPEIAVENPDLWARQLKGLEAHLAQGIAGVPNVEPKLSMLSMEIAKQDGGPMLHVTQDGQVVDAAWVQEQTDGYLSQTRSSIEKEMKQLAEESQRMELFEGIKNEIAIPENRRANGNFTKKIRTFIDEMLEHTEEDLRQRVKQLTDDLRTITDMQEFIDVKFNPTAGFVDIGHRHLNKFSTLFKELKKEGLREGIDLTPESTLVVHIGDSGTDIPPTTELGPGEANEGVDSVFVVGVDNSTSGLRKAVEARGARGKMTARPAILGLKDTILGIEYAVADAPLPTAA